MVVLGDHPARDTFLGSVSALSATNAGWRSLSSSVHSRKSIATTTRGPSQRQAAILSAVIPVPHRPFDLSGRFVNGHSVTSSFAKLVNRACLDAGVKPARTLPAYLRSRPSK